MSSFEVLVRQIDEVEDHPNADRLSICKILGYHAITAKNEDGSHRFKKGELIVYVPESAIIPDDVLKEQGYWNTDKDVGMLSGKGGNRVKAIRLRSVLSQGLVWKLRNGNSDMTLAVNGNVSLVVSFGQDVGDFFGIAKYEPPVPLGMSGEVASVHEFAFNFDIENAQNFPGFLDNDEVEATEKLHGTCARISYRSKVSNDELFASGNVAIASKGLGSKGLVFKNNEANTNNLYVKIFTELGLPEKLESLGEHLNVDHIDLFGEIFGKGVQDLHYGFSNPEFRAFDIAIDGEFLPTDEKVKLFEMLGVERVPVLYRGPWNLERLIEVRDGTTTINEAHVQEGIVVTAVNEQTKRYYMNHNLRPFLKMINPDYLLRKGETTEFQ